MRTMLLSFKPSVYERVINGIKIYEHRRTFPDEPIKAYLYVSRPVQKITGVMYLGNRQSLEDWKRVYSYDIEAIDRIERYQIKNRYVMEIQQFQKTNGISLSDILKIFPDFRIPQMYIYLDGTALLDYLENNIKPEGDPIYHSFENITSDMICRN